MFGTLSPLSFLLLMIGPLGMQEMLIILVVALIVFGPRKLPQIGKTLGKSIAEFRRTSTELRSTLEREVQMEEFRAARTEVSDLKKEVTSLGGGLDPAAGSEPEVAKAPRGGNAGPGASTEGPATGAPESAGASGTAESPGTPVPGAETPAGETSSSTSPPDGDATGAAPESAEDSGK